MNHDWLTNHRERTRTALARARATEQRWSWARLGTFAAAVAAWIPSFESSIVAASLCGVGVVLFVLAVRRHRTAKTLRVSTEHRLTICDEALTRCGGRVTLVRSHDKPAPPPDGAAIDPIVDDGRTWALTGQEIDDLNLYAPPVGVFGLLNRTSSAVGARRLAHMLEHPCLSSVHVLARQHCVRRLDERPAHRIAMMAEAAPLRSTHADLDAVVRAIRQAKPLPASIMAPVARVWGIISGLVSGVALVQASRGAPGWGWVFAALLMFNALVLVRMYKTLRRAITPWQDLTLALGAWTAAARAGAAHLGEILSNGSGGGSGTGRSSDAGASRRLKPAARGGVGRASVPAAETDAHSCAQRPRRLKPAAREGHRLETGATPLKPAARDGVEHPSDHLHVLRDAFARVTARDVLPALHGLIGWSQAGGMMHAVCNVVFFYDLHVADAITRRVCAHRDDLLRGMAALAELEALAGLACFAYEQPVACYPVPAEGRLLHIQAGRHPLIDPGEVVPNDVRLDDEAHVWIVTGSNMAGKSTLLRVAGVSTLLGQVGTAVTAEAMRWSPVRLVSDLGVQDNLAKHESYFLAEVRHLKRIVSPPADAAPILGLIDEPFRGTNAQEQVAAALAVTEHLIRAPGMFILATHEHRLTALAGDPHSPSPARNFHFRENLEHGAMVFDHRLHPGPATTRNALRVLEAEDYPSEILAAARRWLAEVSASPGSRKSPPP